MSIEHRERETYEFAEDPDVRAILEYYRSPEGQLAARREKRMLRGVYAGIAALLLGGGACLGVGIPKANKELATVSIEDETFRRCGLVVGRECEPPLGLAPPKPEGCATATATKFIMSREELMTIARGTIPPDVSEALVAPGVCAVDIVVDGDDVPLNNAFEVLDEIESRLPPLPEDALVVMSDPDMRLNGLVVHNMAVSGI